MTSSVKFCCLCFFPLRFLFLLLVLTTTLISCGRQKTEVRQTTAPAALPVEAFLVRDTLVNEEMETIGTLTANESVEIVSELNKKVVRILMKEGTVVEEGQLLFKLDDSDIRAEINTLQVEEELARANEQRQKTLLGKGGISQGSYDVTANRLHTLQAEIATLEVELSKTEIRAPFDGKIGLRSVSEGAWVTPALPLASLQDIRKLKVLFTVPERYAGDVRAGQQVWISTDRSARQFPATVSATDPAVDAKTRTLKVQAILHHPPENLVPGISVKVDLDLRTREAGLFIPTQALIPSQQGYSVYLVKEGKTALVLVETGLRTAAMVQVLEHLSPGDTLITTNLLRLKPGIPVLIQHLR